MSSLILPRRSLLKGLAALIAAPAIVKATSLMAVKSFEPSEYLGPAPNFRGVNPFAGEAEAKAAMSGAMYELSEPFFGQFDGEHQLKQAGEVIRWDGMPNTSMRPLTPLAMARVEAYIKGLPEAWSGPVAIGAPTNLMTLAQLAKPRLT